MDTSAEARNGESEYIGTNKYRQAAANLLKSDGYCLCIVIVSLVNLILVIIEIDSHASHNNIPAWAKIGTFTIIGLFTIEMLLRAYTFGWKNFRDAMFVLEAVVLLAEIGALALRDAQTNSPGLSILRIFRLVKLTRSSIVVMYCPELRMIVCSLIGAAKPLFWGGVLMTFLFTVLGIIAVQVIHPLNEEVARTGIYDDCERCPRAFASVWLSVLTLFQGCIAGDSWGQVAIPLIEMHPATSVYFSMAFVLIAIAVMNVMLASVVDSAAQARRENDHYIADSKVKERAKLQKQCHKICEQMDTDASNSLTFEELLLGYRENKGFHHLLKAIDVHEEDLETVFCVMDEDESGTVDYSEFTSQLFKMKASDSHTMLLFLKHHVAKIAKETKQNLGILKSEIITGMHRALKMLSEEGEELHRIESAVLHDPSMPGSTRKDETILSAPPQVSKEPDLISQMFPPFSLAASERDIATTQIESNELMQSATVGSGENGESVQMLEDTRKMHGSLLASLRRLEDKLESFAKHPNSKDIVALHVEPKLARASSQENWQLPYCCNGTSSGFAYRV